jgi:tetratricopeptide (TPR) repeat protein
MAPEQFLGRPADARCDQFSFALALHEGLCGQRAFVGETVEELWESVIAGRRRPMPADRRPPRWLRKIIDRALEVDPERRFPSMQALLADLERGLGRGRRMWLAIGGFSLAATAAIVARSARPELCTGGAAEIATVWNEQTRAAARAAFTASGKPYTGQVWERTERQLDEYAAAWAEMYRSACEATVVHGEQSSEALDLRMRCLDRRRGELSALLAVFGEADESTINRAAEATDALTPIASCADLDALSTRVKTPEDPRIRERVATLRTELARAKALREAGRYDEGLKEGERVHAEALALDYLPLRAETGVILGSLHSFRGDTDKALAALDRAFLDALACDHAEQAAWAAISATHAVGHVGRRFAEGRRWGELAEPLIERIGGDALALVALRSNLGNIAFAEGDLKTARERFKSALKLAEAKLAPDHVIAARTLGNLGAVMRRTGEHKQALAHYQRAGEIFRARLGPDHPALATLANNIGALLQVTDDHEGAMRSYREVLALAGNSLSPTSSTLGHAHSNLAEVLLERGDARAAVSHYTSASEIWAAAHGAVHPNVALALVGLGRAHVELGEPGPALVAVRRALEIRRETRAKPAELAEAQFELARALALARPDDLTEALAAAESAAEQAEPGEARQKIREWLHKHAPG